MDMTSIATGEKAIPQGEHIEGKDGSDFVSWDLAGGTWCSVNGRGTVNYCGAWWQSRLHPVRPRRQISVLSLWHKGRESYQSNT